MRRSRLCHLYWLKSWGPQPVSPDLLHFAGELYAEDSPHVSDLANDDCHLRQIYLDIRSACWITCRVLVCPGTQIIEAHHLDSSAGTGGVIVKWSWWSWWALGLVMLSILDGLAKGWHQTFAQVIFPMASHRPQRLAKIVGSAVSLQYELAKPTQRNVQARHSVSLW